MTDASAGDDGDGLRRHLIQHMPDSIRTALAAYHRFTADEPPPDAKGFAAWHAAAKAALAHVEALVKLVRWAEGPSAVAEAGDGGAGNDGIDDLLGQARQAIDQYQDDDDDED